MPKVTEEYMESKRKMIVDACYQVCLRKPVEMVTISDVIAETGMSQGAIYRYYNGLDDILADLASEIRSEYNMIDTFEAMLGNKDATLEELIYQVCDCLADIMEKHLTDIQKINFDFGVLVINEPERAAKIMAEIKTPSNLEYLGNSALPRLIKGAYSLGYKPIAKPEDIVLFVSASYAGLEKLCIMSHCYGTGYQNVKADPKKLFGTLADTMIVLLGGKPNVK